MQYTLLYIDLNVFLPRLHAPLVGRANLRRLYTYIIIIRNVKGHTCVPSHNRREVLYRYSMQRTLGISSQKVYIYIYTCAYGEGSLATSHTLGVLFLSLGPAREYSVGD